MAGILNGEARRYHLQQYGTWPDLCTSLARIHFDTWAALDKYHRTRRSEALILEIRECLRATTEVHSNGLGHCHAFNLDPSLVGLRRKPSASPTRKNPILMPMLCYARRLQAPTRQEQDSPTESLAGVLMRQKSTYGFYIWYLLCAGLNTHEGSEGQETVAPCCSRSLL